MQKMIRVGLFLKSEPQDGGVFQYNQSILDAFSQLPDDKYDLVVGYVSQTWANRLQTNNCSRIKFPPLSIYARLIGFLWIHLRMPIPLWQKYISTIFSHYRAFKKAKCELWIFPSQDQQTYLAPVRSLGVIHDLMHRYERQFPEVSAQGEYLIREKRYNNICRYAAGVLVDSNIGKTHVHESYATNIKLIHVLPFIAPSYIFKKDVQNNYSEEYKLPDKFLFYPAQFWEHKNHKGLLKAAKTILPKAPNLKLIFVGTRKNGFDECMTTVKELGLNNVVSFLGYVPSKDMPKIYRRARALIMPTFFGPTNIPPLEAFALGCPVAVSDIYGMKEQMNEAALLFNPANDADIADVMYRLWTDDNLCRSLIERGTKHTECWNKGQFNTRFAWIINTVLSTTS